MGLKELLAANPEAKAEFDVELKKSRAELDAHVKKIAPFLANRSYPHAVQELAVKVLTGKSQLAALEGAIAVLDAQEEERKSTMARKETTADTPPENRDVAQDGTVTNESDYAAAVQRLKGGV